MQDTFVIDQIQTFALTIGLGVFMGLVYDFLRAVKSIIRFSRTMQVFIDLGFWFGMTVVVFIALLSSNWGEVRVYVFFGMGIGGLFYTLLVSRLFYALMTRFLGFLVRLVGYIISPFIWLGRKVYRAFVAIKSCVLQLESHIKIVVAKIYRKKKE